MKKFWLAILILVLIVEVKYVGKMLLNNEGKFGEILNKAVSGFHGFTLSIDSAFMDRKEVNMPVSTIMQNPELPNGCEITSLTAVLNYYGYDVSKTEMSDRYLPKEKFITKNNKMYGPSPYKAYAGEPRDSGGYFAYAPPIVEAANKYFQTIGEDNQAIDISGSSRDVIMGLVEKEIPVIIWVTLDLSEPKVNRSWYFNDTKEYFPAPSNLHVVVLDGYFDDKVRAMNPLKGQVTYNADAFFDSYQALGSHALIIKKNGN